MNPGEFINLKMLALRIPVKADTCSGVSDRGWIVATLVVDNITKSGLGIALRRSYKYYGALNLTPDQPTWYNLTM